MSEHHVLPSGGWIELREPERVSERLRRPVKQAMLKVAASGQIPADGTGLAPELLAAYDDLQDLGAVALIASWSFEQPVTVDNLIDLPACDYEDIQKVTAPLTLRLMPDFATASADPKAPPTS